MVPRRTRRRPRVRHASGRRAPAEPIDEPAGRHARPAADACRRPERRGRPRSSPTPTGSPPTSSTATGRADWPSSGADTARSSASGRCSRGAPTGARRCPGPPGRGGGASPCCQLPAVPLVGALAMSAAAAAGLLPLPTHLLATRTTRMCREGRRARLNDVPGSSRQVLAGDPSASQVVAAASALAPADRRADRATRRRTPRGVNEVAQLLQLEQASAAAQAAAGVKAGARRSRRKLAAQPRDLVVRAVHRHNRRRQPCRRSTSSTPRKTCVTAKPSPAVA